MLRIKVFQNGVNRVYITRSFEEKSGKNNEVYEFMEAMAQVDFGSRELIHFVDEVTDTNVFVSPVMCLIEAEKVTEK